MKGNNDFVLFLNVTSSANTGGFNFGLRCSRDYGVFLTHRGIFRQKPLRDCNIVIGNFPWDVLSVLCPPEQCV